MPKARSAYFKKRRFSGNRFTVGLENEENLGNTRGHASTTLSHAVNNNDGSTPETLQKPSASARKIATPEPQNVLGTDGEPSGFRLIDLSILSSIFKLLPCGECKQLTLEMFENVPKRKGCASSLELRCQGCSWKEAFYTSPKTSYFFEVNRRLVYAMRSVGCGGGAAAAERFCGLMNMPPIPRASPYAAHNKALLKATKEVCQESMSEAAKEIHTLKGKAEGEVADCGVSCDGTWQRRGFFLTQRVYHSHFHGYRKGCRCGGVE